MKKIFGLAAIVFALAACNKIEPVDEPVDTRNGIPFTATIAPASTKALADAGTTLTATWAQNEKVALIYEVSSTTHLVEANVDEVTGGKAVISATLDPIPADNTSVTLIYPYSAVDESTKVLKTDLLAAQNGALTGEGSISQKYDVRTGSGTFAIDGASATLKSSVSLVNQFAIYKFTLNAPATAFSVTINAVDYVATPASATAEIFMALPAISAKAVSFKASEAGGDYYFSAPSVSLAAGKYYRSDLSAKLKTNPGRLNGQFSVAADKKVYFSQGNLQWFNDGNIHKTTDASSTYTPIAASSYNGGIFTFADHQWDIVEKAANANYRLVGNVRNQSSLVNFTASNRIDLFMWATSGNLISDQYLSRPFAVCMNSSWPASAAYGPLEGDIAGTNCDWGVFNAILNGGDEVNQWRTLTQPEWAYLMNTRTNAQALRGVGTVNGIRGLILLPDDWSGASIVTTSVSGKMVTTDNSDKPAAINWAENTINSEQWAVMEAAGAVFLPAAGTLDPSNNSVGYNNESDVKAGVSYWTASWREDRNYAHALDLGTGGGTYINWRFDRSSRAFGRAVRLVKNVP